MTRDASIPSTTAIRLAFGRWAIREAEKEVDEDFYRFRAIPGDLPISLLELIGDWSPQDQLALLRSQVKSFLNPKANQSGVELFEVNEREREVASRFPYPMIVSRSLQAFAERQRSGDFRLPKGMLKRSLARRLESTLGPAVERLGGVHTFLTHVSGTTVYTEVDFGSRYCQVRYTQRLLPSLSDVPVGLASNAFALSGVSLMTLAGSAHTSWCYLTSEDIPHAVDLLGQVCIEFIEAVPGIIEEARAITM